MRVCGRVSGVCFLACGLVLGGCGRFESARGAEGLLEVAVPKGPAPVEYTRMAMDPYDANARYVGTAALAGAYFTDEPAYLALFEDNARDSDPSVRAAAMRGLANHGEPRHALVLAGGLKDVDKQVRLEAARGLQRLHNPAVVDALLGTLRPFDARAAASGGEPEAEVRAEAATALGQYAQSKVLEGLIAGLRDENLSVNRAALWSLRVLTGNDFGLDHAAWVGWRSESVSPFAGQSVYTYPVFSRSRSLVEYLPFVPPPPNEVPAPPAGMPRSP
jgi:hypothetical protein